MSDHGFPTAEPLATERFDLEPLRPAHAREMAPLLADPRLHEFTGGRPEGEPELRARYERQAVGHSPDGAAGWLNWVVRGRDSGEAMGTVQVTLTRAAELAWVVGVAHQGAGVATEAAAAVMAWLRSRGVGEFTAHIRPDHDASAAVARHLGMAPTTDTKDGEVRWRLESP